MMSHYERKRSNQIISFYLRITDYLMPNTDADLASALDTLRSEKLEEGPKLIALDRA